MRDLLAAWAGHDPAPALVDHVHGATDGNPFFVTALLRDLAERDEGRLGQGITELAPATAATAAPTVAGLVTAAVARCGPGADELAAAAAVLGDTFRADAVAAVTRLPVGSTLALVERLVHARLVGQAADDPGRFRFTHALVRESVLAAVAVADRRALHRRAASVLEGRPERGDADVLRHLLAAGDEAMLARAAELALSVSEDLVGRGAPEEAAAVLANALAALDRTAQPDPRARTTVVAALAVAELSSNDIVVGRAHLREAAAAAVELGDPSLLRSEANAVRPPALDSVDEAMVAIAEQLVALSPPGTRVRAQHLCLLGIELSSSPDTDRARRASAEAVDIARALHDEGLLRQALLTWHLLVRSAATGAERRAAMEEVLALRAPLGKRLGDVTANVFLVGDCLEVGDAPSAQAASDAALVATDGFGATHLRWLALRSEVLLATAAGRFDDAERTIGEAAAVAARLALPEAMLLQMLQLVCVRYHQRRLAELHPLLSALAPPEPVPPTFTVALAWMAAELAAPDAGERVEAAVAVVDALPRGATWVALTALATEAAAAVGFPDATGLAGRSTSTVPSARCPTSSAPRRSWPSWRLPRRPAATSSRRSRRSGRRPPRRRSGVAASGRRGRRRPPPALPSPGSHRGRSRRRTRT